MQKLKFYQEAIRISGMNHDKTEFAYLFPSQSSWEIALKSFREDKELAAIIDVIDRETEEELGSSFVTALYETPEELWRNKDFPPKTTHNATVLHRCFEHVLSRELGREPIPPKETAGHSLGLLANLVAIKVCSYREGLRLSIRLGNLLENSPTNGGMFAVAGLQEGVVQEICSWANSLLPKDNSWETRIVNFNSPKLFIIAGAEAGLKHAADRAKSVGATVRRIAEYQYHHKVAMADVTAGLAATIDKLHFSDPCTPVRSFVTAESMHTGDQIKNEFLDLEGSPVGSQVFWYREPHKLSVIQTMISQGVEDFVVFSRELRNWLRGASINVYLVSSLESLKSKVKSLAEKAKR